MVGVILLEAFLAVQVVVAVLSPLVAVVSPGRAMMAAAVSLALISVAAAAAVQVALAVAALGLWVEMEGRDLRTVSRVLLSPMQVAVAAAHFWAAPWAQAVRVVVVQQR